MTSLLSNPWCAIAVIIVGFYLLIKGADWLVDGASAMARHWGISNLIIGLTVVAFGTSMPEFIVSTIAAVQHNTEIALTNILGSNAINIFIILGFTAIIYPITSQSSCRTFDIPWSLLAGLLVFLFATYTCPEHFDLAHWGRFTDEGGYITAIEGMGLLVCFVIFLYHSISSVKKNPDSSDNSAPSISLSRACMLILVGLVTLVLGGEMIVRSATSLAQQLGVSDAVIGLTIVALGTSLPELATSCMAAYKHNADLALGNVIGSNIFNVFFILGVSALIHPLPTYSGLWLDAAMVIISSILVMLFVYGNKEHQIKRWHGVVLVLTYAVYLTYRLVSL